MHNANLDYANTMLDIYLEADDWQPEAISHYLELAIAERVKIDRERELVRMMEKDDDTF
jgi:hypothetical protein